MSSAAYTTSSRLYPSATAGPSSPPRSPSISQGALSPRKSSLRGLQNAHPRTPSPRPRRRQRRGKGKGKGKGPMREDPRDDLFAANTAAARHSHGLSWNSTTRDSVVDNLLFGLNSLSRSDVNEMDGRAQDEEERHRYLSSLTSQFTANRPMLRSRGHTHSSSTSDFDRNIMSDSPSSKFSMGSAKGRRSNSSTNFGQNLAGRMKASGRGFGMGRTSSDVQTNKPSDGSSSTGGGYGSGRETNRLAWNGKTMSMDHMHAENGTDAPAVLDRPRPVPSMPSKYESATDLDAAPEPSIAGGPRKMQNPTATGPVYVNAATSKNKASTLRKITTQQDLRSAGNPPRLSPPIPQDIRSQAADFVRTSSMRGTLPPPSAHDMRAPSPAVASRRREPSPPRDKPGFFKRVFGGSSSRAVSTPVAGSNQSAQQNGNEKPPAVARSASQASAGSHPPQNEVKQLKEAASAPPPTLNKKPSSFFRRRKKSTSEAVQPPPLPIPPSNTNLRSVKAAEPSSSVSSLRKVMDPFLTQETSAANGKPERQQGGGFRPQTADSKNEHDDSEDPDMFHSGYTPPPDASLGSRHPFSREHSARPSLDRDADVNTKMKVKKRKPEALITASSQGFDRQPSTGTLSDELNGEPKVSPLSDHHPHIPRSQSPPSRPSTADSLIASRDPVPATGSNQDMRSFSANTNGSLDMNDEGWIVTRANQDRPASKSTERLRLQPTPSEERLNANAGNFSPVEGATTTSASNKENLAPISPTIAETERILSQANLLLPTVTIDGSNASRTSRTSSDPTIIQVPPEFHDDGAEYRERARKIFEGDEEDVLKCDAAAWMGERNTLSTRTLQAYMQLFDFSGLNILTSLKILCMRLVLRGETQQFDRIITALSARWCECNPRHGFKAQDVVHTIIYSLILLNTDLHLADIGEKMSRSAYVKNTLPTITRVVTDAAPDAFDETLRVTPRQHRPSLPWTDSSPSMPSSPIMPRSATPVERSESSFSDSLQIFAPTSNKRLSVRPGVTRNDSDNADSGSNGPSNTLVNFPWMGSMRGWEIEIEHILKTFFNSIKSDPLPLHRAAATDVPSANRNLSVADLNNTLKRTGSVVSKAPSDNMSFRSKQDFRTMTMRWQGRGLNRSRPKLYPVSTVGSSRTSLDDSGFWSPAQSSKFSFSKTLTSASVGSFSHFSPTDSFKHSIGFANALSQAIIREENTGGDSETFSVPGGLLEDESLTLEGAPWAKEGLVKHKHHLETQDRKAKDRNWNECFAVISKGKLTLFAFNTSGKAPSFGRKNHFMKSGKASSVTGAKVGGGDWMGNAEQLDIFVLRQTIASTLPPPGYSKARPHVWALSLPTGAVHLFQVGTPEIAEEFMTTANYWSARLSKEPLSGGVSNVEYGWSDNIINSALLGRPDNSQRPPASMQNRSMHGHSMSTDRPRRSSLQSSVRNSFDTGFGSAKPKLSGDKVTIMDWEPPSQSMMASQLMEVDQLRQLTAYVKGQEEELERHNELKHAIVVAYSSRHPNFNKAMNNWQRKSDYLLREIVKFRTYIDSLTAAQKAKDAFYAKKAEGRLSPVAKDDDHPYELPNISSRDFPARDIHTSG
ncbi:PH and SEC7 domain-containing [Lecanosticta acicola]|uniref:PH and SEC7 domain-containing n=1 Tax=Lecanosticta acicola TaxID=111012 RepID=A0AAI8Z1E6_9PEZI|nr:PH and SEC7 domain-containing [Lecanosticta acicola]